MKWNNKKWKPSVIKGIWLIFALELKRKQRYPIFYNQDLNGLSKVEWKIFTD